eukprot:12323725-Karenia_brevis.AAC.1
MATEDHIKKLYSSILVNSAQCVANEEAAQDEAKKKEEQRLTRLTEIPQEKLLEKTIAQKMVEMGVTKISKDYFDPSKDNHI